MLLFWLDGKIGSLLLLDLIAIRMKLKSLRVEMMDPLLRERLSFGQDATRLK